MGVVVVAARHRQLDQRVALEFMHEEVANVAIQRFMKEAKAMDYLERDSKWNGAFDDGQCNSHTNVCESEGQDQTASAWSSATLSNVFIVARAAVAAGGVVMRVLSGKSASSEKTARYEKRVRVTPVVGQRDVGFALGGRF